MAGIAPLNFGVNPQSMSSSAVAGYGAETDAAKPFSVLLLAGAMGALVVAAEQVIDAWADGHLLVGWAAMWLVTFVALALMATPFHWASNAIGRWIEASRTRRAEAEMWEYARHDPRVMEDLQMAISRYHTDH